MPADSNSELISLRRQLFFQLVALVVVAASLTVFLYRQASIEGKQIAQAQKIIAAYKLQEPNVIKVLNQLVAYGQKHPDFNTAVLKKYGLGSTGGSSVPAAASK